MLFRKVSTILITSILLSTVAFAEDLSYLPDPIVSAATADQCTNTITNNTNKITTLCNKNITEYSKIDQAGIKLADKLNQIELTRTQRIATTNDTYDNKVNAVQFQIANLTAKRAEILANCVGGIFSGNLDCGSLAAQIAIRITQLLVKIDQIRDRQGIVIAKINSNATKQVTKAEATYENSVTKSEAKIAGNNNKITTYNNAIVACNAPAVTCPAA